MGKKCEIEYTIFGLQFFFSLLDYATHFFYV
jgi:hypothetical protein